MAIIHSVITLNRDSGIPADAVQMGFTFAVPTTPAPDADLDAIASALSDFFSSAPSGLAMESYLADTIRVSADGSAHTLEHYDITTHLDGSAHGSPVRTDPFPIFSTGADALPAELAVVLTYHQNLASYVEFGPGGTRPRARRRGRLYFGPLATAVLSQDATSNEGKVASSFLTDFVGAGSRLINDVDTQWVVWSRANQGVGEVVGCWADNAFDIQRRRGQEATQRTTYP